MPNWKLIFADYYSGRSLLELCKTHGITYATLYKKMKDTKKKTRGGAWKLTEEQKTQIFKHYQKGKKQTDIARKFKISPPAVHRIIRQRK